MPVGSKGNTPAPANAAGDKPVVFQKYFKNNHRTYASQVKLSQNGKKYLVLTEGHRDPETEELKKHTLIVFEQDLKQFFSMLQETVQYLRANKDPGNTVAGMTAPAATPATPVRINRAAKPAKPPVASKPVGAGSVAKPALSSKPLLQSKPAAAAPAAKVQPRPAASRPGPAMKPAVKPAYRPGTRSNGK